MPLSPEDQALIEQDFNAQSLSYLFSGGYGPMLERLLNACRLEERAKAEGEVEGLKREVAGRRKQLNVVEQAAGKALGYPWFRDDQKNFPGTTEADGVCVGEHAPETIVEELADRFAKIKADLEGERASLARVNEWARAELAGLHAEYGAHLSKAEARIADLTQGGEEPSEPGAFVGDIFFGDREHTTRGTHRWSGSAWERLPSEEEVLTELLAKARAERDTWRKTAERMVEEPDALVAALSRATQAEERLDHLYDAAWELTAALCQGDTPSGGRSRIALEAAKTVCMAEYRRRTELAKLKAAPLQGDGSSSASSTEHSPSGRTSAPSSTGKEG